MSLHNRTENRVNSTKSSIIVEMQKYGIPQIPIFYENSKTLSSAECCLLTEVIFNNLCLFAHFDLKTVKNDGLSCSGHGLEAKADFTRLPLTPFGLMKKSVCMSIFLLSLEFCQIYSV
jgi:hypothetical protein